MIKCEQRSRPVQLQDLKCTGRSAVVSACPNQSNVPFSCVTDFQRGSHLIVGYHWVFSQHLMVEAAAVAGSSLWWVITVQTCTNRPGTSPKLNYCLNGMLFTLNHSYCEWKCEHPHCALSFMLNLLFLRNTWAANLSRMETPVSPVTQHVGLSARHEYSMTAWSLVNQVCGDMWQSKAAATFAVRLRLPRRDKPPDRHSSSAAGRRRVRESSHSRNSEMINVIRI